MEMEAAMNAHSPTLARHTKRVPRPMADLSPGAREERIRNHPPKFDADKVKSEARVHVVHMFAEVINFTFFGGLLKISSAGPEKSGEH